MILSAFMDIPRQMGRSGAESIDDLFFTLLLKNAGFFSSANANLLQGADTKFGPDALTVAKTTFRKQKAGPGGKPKDQKPINIRPEYLVVPVELETEAELLMGSAQLMIDAQGSPTKIPVDNPHRNKYRIISTPHLSDSYYQGASARPGICSPIRTCCPRSRSCSSTVAARRSSSESKCRRTRSAWASALTSTSV
jgi:phage major head subunit gpT-like protein